MSEQRKRQAAELEKRNIQDARAKERKAHANYKDRVEAYIKAQGDALREHDIDLVLREDSPWGS